MSGIQVRAMEQSSKKQKKVLVPAWRLFLDFLWFGCYTFGGGWSIIAQIQNKYIDKQKIVGNEELVDMISIGRSLPGIMIGNVSILFGYHCAGTAGAFACMTGMCTVPVAVMSAVTALYSAFRNNVWFAAAMAGVRPAVVPIMIAATLKMLKSSIKDRQTLLVCIGAFVLYTFLGVGSIVLVLLGAVIGLVICRSAREKVES